MKTNTALRVVESNDLGQSSEFGISLDNSAHIMSILREQIYTDKVLAVLREYSANAWDSHRAAGIPTTPIKVVLPTYMEPTLTVQDFGQGLSRDDIFQVYTQYGASTKRSDNNTVGMLGIGCKSGFAYSDSFTIVSCFQGMRSTYVAVLDASEKGNITLLAEEPCGQDVGISIQIPVKPGDVGEFRRKAEDLFKWFDPRPDINTSIPSLELVPGSEAGMIHGLIEKVNPNYYEQGKWSAVMGCVPYKVNVQQLVDQRGDATVAECIKRISGALYFGIGEVHISASREELKYDDFTKKALTEKFQKLIDEFVQKTLEGIKQCGLSKWEQRLRAQVFRQLHMGGVAGVASDLAGEQVSLKDEGVQTTTEDGRPTKVENGKLTFWQLGYKKKRRLAVMLDVERETRLIIRDDRRTLSGYDLKSNDFVVCGPRNAALASELLTDLIIRLEIEGIPMVPISSIPWVPQNGGIGGRKVGNVKHAMKQFRLNNLDLRSSAKSDCWEVVTRVPQPSDPFVIITNFVPIDGSNIFHCRKEDVTIANVLGSWGSTSTAIGTLPDVYGYKSTLHAPVTVDNCVGTHYSIWRKAWLKSLAEIPAVRRQLQLINWKQKTDLTLGLKYRSSAIVAFLQKAIEELAPLGSGHRLLQLLQKRSEVEVEAEGLDRLERIGVLIDADFQGEADVMLAEVYADYPLFSCGISLEVLWNGSHSERWLEYVQLMDQLRTKGEDHEDPAVHSDQ